MYTNRGYFLINRFIINFKEMNLRSNEKKAIITLCFGTVAVVSDIYVAQPILPLLSRDFGVSHAVASLAVSLNILALSMALLIYGPLSDHIGRKPVMVITSFLLSIPTLLIAFVADFSLFLALRTVQGLFVAGIAAIAMAYIVEEFPPHIVGRIIGIYFSSMVAAGFTGRVLSGVLSGLFHWKATFITFGIMNLAGAWAMYRFLPESKKFTQTSGFKDSFMGMLGHFCNRRLVGVFFIGFMLFFAFTGAFTYVTFYLSEAPFNVSAVGLGLIFGVYITGILSPVAGSLSTKFGRRPLIAAGLIMAAIGICITLIQSLPVIVIGLFILCAGLFTIQPCASAFVGDNAESSRGSATSLYLFSYYIGGSVGAVVPGIFWGQFGWIGVIVCCCAALWIALASLIILCR
jgi:YNFM family putative membrane transporter